MTGPRLRLSLAIAAFLMEFGALVVLLVPEARTPSGASVWSWYWPLANTLYFLGLIAAAVVIPWVLVALAAGGRTEARHWSLSLAALALGVLAVAINRLVPYR